MPPSPPPFSLRPPRASDIVPYTGFLANPAVTVWLDDRAQRPLAAPEIESILLHEAWCLWAIDCDGTFVGVTSLYEPDLMRGVARFSIVIGDPRYWNRGLGSAVLSRVLDHAFDTLGLRKIHSDYLEPHVASRRLHEGAGFAHDGRLRADAWRQGRWVDRELVSLLRDEHRPRPRA